MNEFTHRRATEIFGQALEQPEGEARENFVRTRCEGDAALLEDVASLLAAHGAAGDFLETPPHVNTGALLGRRLAESMIGRRIGAWEIENLIHTGGMGAVYLARRVAGDFEQQAALKIIRTEVAHPDLLERFARERQVLARLKHPNIAHLLDGGTTEEGLPYLVMEYVPGQTIERHADQKRLGIKSRLALFEKVCDAVQYAHGHLVIHRDIKPGNVLVAQAEDGVRLTEGKKGPVGSRPRVEDGIPKLLDFGISKLLEGEGGASEATVTQRRVLTPGYASPEQFTGQPVSAASDVYSLGALLYRLLTGRMPFEFDDAITPAEAERRVTSLKPDPPSRAVTAEPGKHPPPAVGNRAPGQLARLLAGDLDIIVMKALRAEPERRYQSAASLAEDLRRYRAGLPVSARPDSLGYRARKFATRHWKGLIATGTAFAALVIGLGAALWQADQARAERDRTQQINEFLQTILVEADPYEAGAEATIRDVLRTAGEMIDARFAAQPDLESSLRLTIGKTQLNLMELEQAKINLARAVQLRRELYGEADERTLETENWLAWLAYRSGEFDTAEQRYRSILARLGPRSSWMLRAETLNEFAIILVDTGRITEARDIYRQALELWLENDPKNFAVAILHNNIAGTLRNLDNPDAAVDGYRRAMALMRQHFPGGDSPYLASNMTNLAILLQARGEHDEAIALHRESLAIRGAALGEEHAATGMGRLHLARNLLEVGEVEEARPHVALALEVSTSRLNPNQLQVLLARATHARLKQLDGDLAAAAAELVEVRQHMQDIDAPERHIEEISEWLEEARETQ